MDTLENPKAIHIQHVYTHMRLHIHIYPQNTLDPMLYNLLVEEESIRELFLYIIYYIGYIM